MKIIPNETKDAQGLIYAYTNPKTDETEISCDDIADTDEILCTCGNSFGMLKDLIYPKIYKGSFMQNYKCVSCGRVYRFFFWSYMG